MTYNEKSKEFCIAIDMNVPLIRKLLCEVFGVLPNGENMSTIIIINLGVYLYFLFQVSSIDKVPFFSLKIVKSQKWTETITWDRL